HASECSRTASRTIVWHALVVAAVVTAQLVVILVVGKAHGTVLALGDPGALVAADERGITAPVLKQDHLFVPRQPLLYSSNQFARKVVVHVLALLLFPHVNQLDGR